MYVNATIFVLLGIYLHWIIDYEKFPIAPL